jgi:DNA-binding ferritin-like protein
MAKMTNKKRIGGDKTRKNMKSRSLSLSPKSSILRNFQREITVQFFEMLLLIKLFHWKTHSYATHKATDDLYSKLNEHMDRFIEVLLGKSGMRIDLMNKKQISLYDLNNQDELVSKVNLFKSYLVDLTNNKAMKIMSNTDLLNIRDEILGDMNQFLYLLSFK